MNSKISEKDKKTWNEFLSNDQKLPDKDNFETETKVNKTRLLDLHGKTLDEANRVIENFIRKSYKEKVHKLIIVTGKGLHSKNEMDPYVSKDLGILRYSVPEYINNNDQLLTFVNEIKEASADFAFEDDAELPLTVEDGDKTATKPRRRPRRNREPETETADKMAEAPGTGITLIP